MSQAHLFAAEATAVTEARESEFHPTPGEVVRALAAGMAEAGHEALPWWGWTLEPAAGEGAILDAVEALFPDAFGVRRRWGICEIRDAARAKVERRYPKLLASCRDFLASPSAPMIEATGADGRWDLAITNPPWSRALDFARACLSVADHVALHVPLATVETPERAAFLRAHPCDVYPLEWRPNYDGRGTIGRAVCWLVWGPGRGGRWFPLRRPG